jgi:hypothetical protein
VKYKVIWTKSVVADLAAIWETAEDRDDVTRAGDMIERELAFDAENVGESRASGHRILIIPPLVAYYGLIANFDVACVVQVWRSKRGRQG